MSNKTHYKIKGVDCRSLGQTDDEFNNQAACGFSAVTVTKVKLDVTCKLCKKAIESADCSDDTHYDNTM